MERLIIRSKILVNIIEYDRRSIIRYYDKMKGINDRFKKTRFKTLRIRHSSFEGRRKFGKFIKNEISLYRRGTAVVYRVTI